VYGSGEDSLAHRLSLDSLDARLGAAGAALTAPAVGAPPAFIHPALEDQECCAVDTQAWLVSYRAADL
jgi:hypothetical protein